MTLDKPLTALLFVALSYTALLIALLPRRESFHDSVLRLMKDLPPDRLDKIRPFFDGLKTTSYPAFWIFTGGFHGSVSRNRESVILVRMLQVHLVHKPVQSRGVAAVMCHFLGQFALWVLSLPEIALGAIFPAIPRPLSAAAFWLHVQITFRVYDLCLSVDPLIYSARQGNLL